MSYNSSATRRFGLTLPPSAAAFGACWKSRTNTKSLFVLHGPTPLLARARELSAGRFIYVFQPQGAYRTTLDLSSLGERPPRNSNARHWGSERQPSEVRLTNHMPRARSACPLIDVAGTSNNGVCGNRPSGSFQRWVVLRGRRPRERASKAPKKTRLTGLTGLTLSALVDGRLHAEGTIHRFSSWGA
jgi:hypothetical protein